MVTGRVKHIAFLCFLGIALGSAAAWQMARNDNRLTNQMANRMAAFEPAAGGESAMAAPAPADKFDPADISAMKVGGPFSLIDQNGKPVTEKDYAGKYKLMYFGFTSCPDICPTELQKFNMALKALGDDAKDIVPIFVTTDPERDTPEVMKDYVALFNPKIVGLTGTQDQLKQIEDEFKVYAVRQDISSGETKSYVMNHSSFTYFLGPDDKLLLIFRNEDPADVLADHIRKVVKK
jgi:protein SCO1/2